jgi:hypothetical protein
VALFSPIISFLIFFFFNPGTAVANHAAIGDLHPEGATKLSSAIHGLYTDLSDLDKQNQDVLYFASLTEPSLDKLFGEKKSEVEIAEAVSGFLGLLNPTQFRTMEVEIGKLLTVEWTTDPQNKKYIALLARLLRGKELRKKALDRAAPMNGETRYDADLRAFDTEFAKAQKKVAEESAEFHHYLAEAKKSANGRAIFIHKYPNAMAFLDKERRTNLEKVADEPILTQGQVYANHGLEAMAQHEDGGEYILPVILPSGKFANVRLGSDPKKFHEQMESAAAHVPQRWSGTTVASRPHPDGTRWIEDPEPTEEPAKPAEGEEEHVAEDPSPAADVATNIPQGRINGAHLYIPAPRGAAPASGTMSKSSVLLEDTTGGEMGLVASPGAVAPHARTLIVEIKGKHYSIDRPFERKELGLDPNLLWSWSTPLTPELRADLAKSGADTSGLNTVPVKGFLAMPIKFSEKLKFSGSSSQDKPNPNNTLNPQELAAKEVLEKKCSGCHLAAGSKALKAFAFPGKTGWLTFLRNGQKKTAIRETAVDTETRWMPPEGSTQLTLTEIAALQAWAQ